MIVCINLVNAQSFVFKQHDTVNFSFRCLTNANEYCDSTIIAIISIELPNGSNIVNNASMAFSTTSFNFLLPTNDSGDYSAILTALGTTNTRSEFTYTVNPQGIEATEQRTEATTRSIYLFFLVGLILFVGFLFTKESQPIKWTFFIFAVIFFLIALNITSATLADEVINPNIENFLDGFTAISWIFYWFAGGLLILIWVFTFINTWIMKKNLENLRKYGGEMI